MHITAHRTLAARLVLLIAAGALIAGCGAFDESPPPPTPAPSASNLIVDAGFEGLAPAWTVFPPANAHEISTAAAHGGASSLALHASAAVPALAASQGLHPAAFPEFLSGYYRVDDWPDAGAMLQFVVKAAGGAPEEVRELRFVIAGAETEPEQSPTARYVFLSRDRPTVGEWTYFGYPLALAFEGRTGSVPQAWTSIDVTLEVRVSGDGGDATVYYDDLYVGPQVDNPNRPKETTK
jgi:hypothetical protein